MMRYYKDLGSASDWLKQISHAARPIRSTAQILVETRHQHGISSLVSQTSFPGLVSTCRLFTQASFALMNSTNFGDRPDSAKLPFSLVIGILYEITS